MKRCTFLAKQYACSMGNLVYCNLKMAKLKIFHTLNNLITGKFEKKLLKSHHYNVKLCTANLALYYYQLCTNNISMTQNLRIALGCLLMSGNFE